MKSKKVKLFRSQNLTWLIKKPLSNKGDDALTFFVTKFYTC